MLGVLGEVDEHRRSWADDILAALREHLSAHPEAMRELGLDPFRHFSTLPARHIITSKSRGWRDLSTYRCSCGLPADECDAWKSLRAPVPTHPGEPK